MPEERPQDRDDSAPRPDATQEDASIWSGRAAVRPPRRGEPEYPEADWADFGPVEREGHWWTPIAVGFAALVLLGLLGFGIAVIVQNSGSETGTPEPTPTTRTTTGRATVPDATAVTPTVTEAVSTTPTTEPADTEVLVPALRGMPLADARAALERSGLTYRVIRRSSDAEPGTVIDSDPPEGRLVPSDTRITLVVAAVDTAEPSPSSPATAPSGN